MEEAESTKSKGRSRRKRGRPVTPEPQRAICKMVTLKGEEWALLKRIAEKGKACQSVATKILRNKLNELKKFDTLEDLRREVEKTTETIVVEKIVEKFIEKKEQDSYITLNFFSIFLLFFSLAASVYIIYDYFSDRNYLKIESYADEKYKWILLPENIKTDNVKLWKIEGRDYICINPDAEE